MLHAIQKQTSPGEANENVFKKIGKIRFASEQLSHFLLQRP